VKFVENFLPSPDQLILKEETIKVTLSLSKPSVLFFKQAAKKKKIPYQKMIRKLLDHYTLQFSTHH